MPGAQVKIPVIFAPATPLAGLCYLNDPKDPRAGRIVTLRNRILSRCEGSPTTVVMAVTSPAAGEGRTRLAAELAISFAQHSRATLLIDADLRRPQLHLLFDAGDRPGLAQSLETGAAPYLSTVGGVPGLHLLAAGSVRRNPMDLLSHERFPRLMENWRSRFELVVLDTPPLTLYADGLVIAGLAGRALMVARAGHTPSRLVEGMLRRLDGARSDVVGTVLNHF